MAYSDMIYLALLTTVPNEIYLNTNDYLAETNREKIKEFVKCMSEKTSNCKIFC